VIRRQQIFFLLLVFAWTISFGQNKNILKKKKTDFDRIFGSDRLLVLCVDTINTDKKLKVIYSLDSCSIVCLDNNGVTQWTTNLKKHDCRLVTFKTFYSLTDKKEKAYKGYDIILQFKDKKIYGLKSKMGKIKFLKKLNIADT
jgi:hypothetical protein